VSERLRLVRAKDEKLQPITAMEHQRLNAVERVIHSAGFGWHRKRCYACSTNLTAKTPEGSWACPWHWPVTQLELCA
jgi:hypothetical protein